jgi:hypothetical protein
VRGLTLGLLHLSSPRAPQQHNHGQLSPQPQRQKVVAGQGREKRRQEPVPRLLRGREPIEQAAEVQREAAARAMALKPVEQDVTVTAATQDAVVLAPQRLAGATARRRVCLAVGAALLLCAPLGAARVLPPQPALLSACPTPARLPPNCQPAALSGPPAAPP